MTKISPFAILGVSVLALAGCAPQSPGDPSPTEESDVTTETPPADVTTISVTTTVLGSVVEQIVACVDDEAYRVDVLMPIGVDPHDFQPSSAQLATIAESGVVVANGLMLEESLVEPLEELEAGGGQVYRMAEMVDPIAYADLDSGAEDGHDHDHDHEGEDKTEDSHDGHDHGEFDPHFWLDMERVATATEMLGAEWAQQYGEEFGTCANEVAGAIRSAEQDVIQTLSVVDQADRVLVTDHEAMNYFAERYDFEIAGVLIRGGSTLAEPSSQELAELIDEIENRGLSAIFGNYHVPSDLLDSIAAESGGAVQVVPLYLGSIGEPGTDFASYQEMMQANARAIAAALGS